MPRHDDLYFGHMLDMTSKAIELTSGVDKEAFDGDEKLHLYISRRF